jgi:hypothetical protein
MEAIIIRYRGTAGKIKLNKISGIRDMGLP